MGSSVVLATAGYDHTIRQASCSIGLLKKDYVSSHACDPLFFAATNVEDGLRNGHAWPARDTKPNWSCCRFWEATSGICYRTLQFADSQVGTVLAGAASCYPASAVYAVRTFSTS